MDVHSPTGRQHLDTVEHLHTAEHFNTAEYDDTPEHLYTAEHFDTVEHFSLWQYGTHSTQSHVGCWNLSITDT